MKKLILSITFLFFILSVIIGISRGNGKHEAALSWLSVVRDIQESLGKIPAAYSAGKGEEAKSYITDAYFGIFEHAMIGEISGERFEFKAGMEQAIRMNISAKRAFELESMFGDIRKAINRKADVSEIEGMTKALVEALEKDAGELESIEVKVIKE